jgi:hypothetical protein
MYRKALGKDLKAIFGVKKIIWDAPERNIEQDCLFVELPSNDIPIVIQEGQESARVRGQISIKGAAAKNLFGFLTKKIFLAPDKLQRRFWFGGREQPVNHDPVGWELKGYKLDFIYFYKAEYNPPSGYIEKIENWFFNLIKGA